MKNFEPVILENGIDKRIKLSILLNRKVNGYQGDQIDRIMKDVERDGFLVLDYDKFGLLNYVMLQNTYMAWCREHNKTYVVVLVNKKINKGITIIDSLDNDTFSKHATLIYSKLESYYENLSDEERRYMHLYSPMYPNITRFHDLKFFVFPKQICFSFFLDRQEIFDFIFDLTTKTEKKN